MDHSSVVLFLYLFDLEVGLEDEGFQNEVDLLVVKIYYFSYDLNNQCPFLGIKRSSIFWVHLAFFSYSYPLLFLSRTGIILSKSDFCEFLCEILDILNIDIKINQVH